MAGAINILSDADVNIKSATKITLDAPNQKTTTGKGHSESYTGQSFSMTGISQSFTGQSISFTGVSVGLAALDVSAKTFTVSNSPFALKKYENKVQFVSGSTTLNGNFSAFVNALTVFS
ncbi:hypothetical protein FOT43_21765 [Serratia marcescens]|nr:hypothetical protein FOT43_21765 [Serratia marcescens]TXE44657.1 hypothetical protein FOT60_12125 [Serratia marcescens]